MSHKVLGRSPQQGRDAAIDVIRGLCIISMVSAHIAPMSVLAIVMHAIPKFDGASGFVLLGGVVLGIIQRKRVASSGLVTVQKASARRVLTLYAAQVFLSVGGTTAAVFGWRTTNLPVQSLSSAELVIHTLLMTLAPPGGDVLRLYVFMLGLSMLAYMLLVRNRWKVVLCCSLVLHLLGQAFPAATSFSPIHEQAKSAGWAGWQFLFISAMVLGWYWNSLNVPAWLRKRQKSILFACLVVTLITTVVSLAAPEHLEEVLFNKYTFPLGRVFVAYAVVAVLYLAIGAAMRRLPYFCFRPLIAVGSRSLDSYIIQSIVLIVFFGFCNLISSSSTAFLLSVATLMLCWVWAEWRLKVGSRNSRKLAVIGSKA